MKDETRNKFYVRAILSQLLATIHSCVRVYVRATVADNPPPVVYQSLRRLPQLSHGN